MRLLQQKEGNWGKAGKSAPKEVLQTGQSVAHDETLRYLHFDILTTIERVAFSFCNNFRMKVVGCGSRKEITLVK